MSYLLYADASSKGGRSSWAFVLKSAELAIEGRGLGQDGINQNELRAILEGLRRIQPPADVTIYTDSMSAIRASKGRLPGFRVQFVKVGKGRGSCPDHARAHHLAREILLS